MKCNVCNEGVESEAEIIKHIKEKHECLLTEELSSWDDEDLYEGFDGDGNRIVENDNL